MQKGRSVAHIPFKAGGDQREDAGKDDDRLAEEHGHAEAIAQQVPAVVDQQLEHLGGQNEAADEKVAQAQVEDVPVDDCLHLSIRPRMQ